jgi:hypothetical protein
MGLASLFFRLWTAFQFRFSGSATRVRVSSKGVLQKIAYEAQLEYTLDTGKHVAFEQYELGKRLIDDSYFNSRYFYSYSNINLSTLLYLPLSVNDFEATLERIEWLPNPHYTGLVLISSTMHVPDTYLLF